jgi:hypothetical protein
MHACIHATTHQGNCNACHGCGLGCVAQQAAQLLPQRDGRGAALLPLLLLLLLHMWWQGVLCRALLQVARRRDCLSRAFESCMHRQRALWQLGTAR